MVSKETTVYLRLTKDMTTIVTMESETFPQYYLALRYGSTLMTTQVLAQLSHLLTHILWRNLQDSKSDETGTTSMLFLTTTPVINHKQQPKLLS